MGDRTNITDARQHDAEQAAGVIEQAMRNEGLIDKDVRLMCEIIAEALDAAGFDVVLRADPDTSDDLFTEARRLLDAATPGPWHCFTDDSAGKDQLELWCDYDDGSWREGTKPPFHLDPFCYDPTPMERATAELIAAAPRLIAALLERAVTAEADRDEAERRERTAVNLANYHRGVAREAGRRADAARPPAPTESTPDPPYQPVAGRPTMDLLDRGTDR